MICKLCGVPNAPLKKTCENCGSILEGRTVNNMTGQAGYRHADGSFTPDVVEAATPTDDKPALHSCSPRWSADDPRYFAAHGAAVEFCIEMQDGSLWVDNVEYASRVNFCPFCGFKAPAQITATSVEPGATG